MRIIKSVSLDHDSAQIADTLPNFSHFVRECLYRQAVANATECLEPKPDRFKGRCNPLSKHQCFVCWPNGKPPIEAVKQWSQDKLAMSFLDARARERNKYLISLNGINKKAPKLPSSPPTKSKIKRIVKWLVRAQR
jgi:hypothetical protein